MYNLIIWFGEYEDSAWNYRVESYLLPSLEAAMKAAEEESNQLDQAVIYQFEGTSVPIAKYTWNRDEWRISCDTSVYL